MSNWLLPPQSSAVARYIECYWFIEKRPEHVSHSHPKLNPDPSAHLIFSPDEQAYNYSHKPTAYKGKGTHWLYPHHQTIQVDHSKPFIHLGVKFHTGALYSLNTPNYSHPSLDTVDNFDANDLLNAANLTVDQLILSAQSNPSKCCKQLELVLLPWILSSSEDQRSDLTQKALQLLGNISISNLGDALNCSQRTLERSFRRVTGLTLKQYLTMNKLEEMLEYLHQRDNTDIEWVEVAYQFGFSDQPHLIRHLKQLIGVTPKAYVKERGFTIDVYGGIDTL